MEADTVKVVDADPEMTDVILSEVVSEVSVEVAVKLDAVRTPPGPNVIPLPVVVAVEDGVVSGSILVNEVVGIKIMVGTDPLDAIPEGRVMTGDCGPLGVAPNGEIVTEDVDPFDTVIEERVMTPAAGPPDATPVGKARTEMTDGLDVISDERVTTEDIELFDTGPEGMVLTPAAGPPDAALGGDVSRSLELDDDDDAAAPEGKIMTEGSGPLDAALEGRLMTEAAGPPRAPEGSTMTEGIDPLDAALESEIGRSLEVEDVTAPVAATITVSIITSVVIPSLLESLEAAPAGTEEPGVPVGPPCTVLINSNMFANG